jgi:hypothetical protein
MLVDYDTRYHEEKWLTPFTTVYVVDYAREGLFRMKSDGASDRNEFKHGRLSGERRAQQLSLAKKIIPSY